MANQINPIALFFKAHTRLLLQESQQGACGCARHPRASTCIRLGACRQCTGMRPGTYSGPKSAACHRKICHIAPRRSRINRKELAQTALVRRATNACYQRKETKTGFVLPPRRWGIKRSFGRLNPPANLYPHTDEPRISPFLTIYPLKNSWGVLSII